MGTMLTSTRSFHNGAAPRVGESAGCTDALVRTPRIEQIYAEMTQRFYCVQYVL